MKTTAIKKIITILIIGTLFKFGINEVNATDNFSADAFPKKDGLDPYFEKKIKMKNVLDNLSATDFAYELTVKCEKKQEKFIDLDKKKTFYQYHLKLPENVEFESLQKIFNEKNPFDERRSHFGANEFYKNMLNRKYSIYCALAIINSSDDKIGPSPDEISALIHNDKEEWNKNINKYAKAFDSLLIDRASYPNEVFIATLPPQCRNTLFSDKRAIFAFISANKWTFQRYFESNIPLNKYSESKNPIIREYGKYFEIIENYKKTGVADFSILLQNQEHIVKWLYLLFGLESEKMPSILILKVFIAYLQSQKELNPFYSTVVMSLFISKGYEFSENTGEYIPNKLGEEMLDYLVKNPTPNNATRIKIIMEGGNEHFISDLMEKYHNNGEWDKLFEGDKNW
jgi:hypothetical protein